MRLCHGKQNTVYTDLYFDYTIIFFNCKLEITETVCNICEGPSNSFHPMRFALKYDLIIDTFFHLPQVHSSPHWLYLKL